VALLTDHQLVNIYLRPRDREGRLIREGQLSERDDLDDCEAGTDG
jgi:hypothetical protein